MSNILENLVNDENLVWGKNLANHPEKFVVKLSDSTVNELKKNKNQLQTHKKESFPTLLNEINSLKIHSYY